MKKPNFIIIGAQKSGTTWLHKQLSQHPNFFLSEPKELNFFHNPELVSKKDKQLQYLKNFEAAKNERFVGEATPHYFWKTVKGHPFSNHKEGHDTAQAIREFLGPNIRMAVALRDPVSRAISAYFHNFAVGRNIEKKGIFWCEPQMGIVDLGFYKRHWEHYVSVFSEDHLCPLLYEDVVHNPIHLIRRVLRFLGEPGPSEYYDSLDLEKKLNTRKRLMMRRSADERASPPKIHPQEVAALLELYRDDIGFVRELMGRPLPHWTDLDGLIKKHCK